MDFSTQDSRSAAETPIRMPIRKQHNGEPAIDGKTACVVLVKGASSRSAQAQMRKEEADRMKKAKGSKAKEDEIDLQKQLSDAAARYVSGFEGVQRPDPDTGKLRDLTNSADDCAWFFDLNTISLPHLMRGDGGEITRDEGESEEDFALRREREMGKWLKPSFSQQVIDCARDDQAFLANAGKG